MYAMDIWQNVCHWVKSHLELGKNAVHHNFHTCNIGWNGCGRINLHSISGFDYYWDCVIVCIQTMMPKKLYTHLYV